MTDIQQDTEATKVKTHWFLSSLAPEHRRAVNDLHNECAMTKSITRCPKTVPKAVLWLSQCKSASATLGAPRHKQFAQLEELCDDNNENEDECDMDGEETEVENAMHQMSFDDYAEHAFSGLK